MLDIDSLLTPLSDDAPSGSDLEYDAIFLALATAGAGKPEQQYGDTVIPAEPPDWRTVREHALSLASRTRDLRVAVWLTRSGARLDGVSGAVAGLRLVHGLLATRWADVHPQLDASDNNDPTMRLNALSPLAGPEAVLADLRSATLTAARGSMTVRDVELGLGLAEPGPAESVPSEAGVLEAMRGALEQDAELAETLKAGREAVEGIVQVLDEQVGSAGGVPELLPLVKLLQGLDTARLRATGGGAQPADAASGASTGAGSAAAGTPGTITSRDDVVRALDRICDWIELNEPSNPAPLLLRRAQRLMSKNFIDIVRDLAPESLEQIGRLAGIDTSSA